MDQIDTDEGGCEGGGDLIEWLTANKLLKAKHKIIEFDVSLQELKEYNLQYLDSFINEDLKLSGMMANRFSKSVKTLQTQTQTTAVSQQPTQIIRTIVLSKEENEAMHQIQSAYHLTTQYMQKLDNDINTLNNVSKENVAKVDVFENEIINKIKIRMNELRNKSNNEINTKTQQISSYLNKIKKYRLALSNAQSAQQKLLNDTNLDAMKRQAKIIKINKKINHQIMEKKPKFAPLVMKFDKHKIFKFIANIGAIDSHHSLHPNVPIFCVDAITTTSAIIKFHEMKCLEYVVEIDKDGGDEKKADWNPLPQFQCANLCDNTQYKVRAKWKKKYGYSPYSNIVTFKTKKIDSLILKENEKNIFLGLMNSVNVCNKFSLLYRASRDGWTSYDFHSKCDDKGKKTVAIIHSDINNVFGGYTSKAWANDDAQIADKNAFLFLIRSSKKYPPQIFNLLQKNNKDAVCHYDDMLCGWGAETDLAIYENCNNGTDSQTTQKVYGLPKPHYLNGDVKNFKVKEVEVFMVK